MSRLTAGSRGLGVFAGLILAVAACTTGAPAPKSSPASPSGPPDVFAGLTYRLDLPSGWIVRGTSTYESRLDGTPDVAAWLTALDLDGPNAFRAYEPRPGATGMRIAINSTTRGPSIFDDSGAISALPGVTGEPDGLYVPIGDRAKAVRFRWTQSIDWGSGAASSRICVGHLVMSEYDPVHVVFSYPTGEDRLAEVEGLMATFEVLGSPGASLAPGATPTPSPTPFDKNRTPEPTSTHHADPALEALLPDAVGGVTLVKQSRTGVELGLAATDDILAPFGKAPADFASATAQSTTPPMLLLSVARLRGVAGDRLQAAMLAGVPDSALTQSTLDGHPVTIMRYGAWPVLFYATGEYVVQIVGDATTVIGLLP